MATSTLAWIFASAWGITTLISVGYYMDRPLPPRPWWFRLGSMVIEVAGLWLALKVIL